MNCFQHANHTAVAVCGNCGKAMCNDCGMITSAGKMVCSTDCAEATEQFTGMIAHIYKKTQQQNRTNAITFLLIGIILLVYGLYEQLQFGQSPLTLYMLAAGGVLLITGLWYWRLGIKSQKQDT